MAVNLITVTGSLVDLFGAPLSLGRVRFKLSRPDWTAGGDILAPQYSEVTVDVGDGTFSVDLQCTDDLEAGATYRAIILYRDATDKDDKEFEVGAFAVPDGGPWALGELLVTTNITPVPADVLALSIAAQEAAAASATTAVAAKDATIAAATYTYQDLAAIDALTSGQIINGKYYYAAKEGVTYLAVTSGGDVPGMTQSGRWSAVRNADGEFSAIAFGIVGDGSTDVADLVAGAAAAIAAKGGGTLKFSAGRYMFGSDVYVPSGVNIVGVGSNDIIGASTYAQTVFSPKTDGVFTDDTVFWLNVSPSNPTTWVQQYPNERCFVENISIDARGSSVGLDWFCFGGTYTFRHLRNRGVSTLIKKPNLYTDGVEVINIHSSTRANTTEYLVYLPGLGDKMVLDNIAAGYTGNEVGTAKGVYVANCRGGRVTGLVNSHHYFLNCQGMPITGAHIESGSITLDNCDTPVFGNFLYRTSEGTGQIIVAADNTNNNNGLPSIRDNVFGLVLGWSVNPIMTTDSADIVFQTNGAAILSGNTRVYTINGRLSTKCVFAAKISTETDGLANLFNRFAPHLAQQSVLIDRRGVHLRHIVESHNLNHDGLASASAETISGVTANLSAGTYYYQAQVIIDSVRLLGRNVSGAEVSTTVTTGQVAAFNVSSSTFKKMGGYTLRVYRGTSAGLYNKYADIPIMNAVRLRDDGDTLSGNPWVSRTTAGVDTLNNAGHSGRMILDGDTIDIETISGVPTLGTWVSGDRVRKIDQSSSVGGLQNSVLTRLTSGTGWVNFTDYIWAQNFLPSTGVVLARRVAAAPSTGASTGSIGDFYVGGGYAYFCIATNTWVRTPVTTF